jgi:hypothetical protein
MLVALMRAFQLCIGMLARFAARTRVKSRGVAFLAHTWMALHGTFATDRICQTCGANSVCRGHMIIRCRRQFLILSIGLCLRL